MSNALLTITDVAERLGTPERFVRRLVFEKRIGYVKVGRYVRFELRDVDAFLASCRHPALSSRAAGWS